MRTTNATKRVSSALVPPSSNDERRVARSEHVWRSRAPIEKRGGKLVRELFTLRKVSSAGCGPGNLIWPRGSVADVELLQPTGGFSKLLMFQVFSLGIKSGLGSLWRGVATPFALPCPAPSVCRRRLVVIACSHHKGRLPAPCPAKEHTRRPLSQSLSILRENIFLHLR